MDNMNERAEAVNYSRLVISGFPMISLESFCIRSEVNEHAVLTFGGLLPAGMGEGAVSSTVVGSPVNVLYYDNSGRSISFFAGVITSISLNQKNGNEVVEVSAMSNSCSMDMHKKSRTFQNTEAAYEEIMNLIAGENKADIRYGMNGEVFKESIGGISVQYKETDWEYLKRLASHKQHGLYADMTSEFPSFDVGPMGRNQGDIYELTCLYVKDIRGYEIDNANYIQGIKEHDYLTYKVTSYQIFKIGDMVRCQGKELYIRQAEYCMKNSVIEAEYLLCTSSGLKQRKYMNQKIQGLSINGTTTEVIRDKVRIQLNIDRNENAEYLFPYSTMSASPDGSGWYCMPEKGDLLRVYFPDEDEKNCFAISSVSSYVPEAGNSNDRMSNPDVKYLRTADNKEIRLAPDGITINADDGKSLIYLDNAGNITISGAGSIKMTASNDITMAAAHNICLYAAENIKVSGQGGSIEMCQDGNTRLTGEYVVEN